ncbi:MAG: DUF2164 domain-containing protein [Acidobacteria bacterium]|nr:DUF2164 domain-containing protein [Acidobacteriota bacterium]
MALTLSRETHQQAVASIERYFREHMDEPIGSLAAGGLLLFFLEEIGPTLYNRGVTDAQARLALQVSEIDAEVHEEPFGYWRRLDRERKPRR